MKEILDTIHKTMYQFFDVCGEDEECNISDKDELLLEVNKAICTNLKALEQKEPFINKPCVSEGVCREDKMKVLEKIKEEIRALSPKPTAYEVVDGNHIKEAVWETLDEVLQVIDKYMAESEKT